MRQRLLIVLTGAATVTVLLFALPLSISDVTDRTVALVRERSNALDRFADLATAALAGGDNRTLTHVVRRYSIESGDPVLVVDATGTPLVDDGIDPHDPAIVAALDKVWRHQRSLPPTRLTPWSAPTLLLYRPVYTDRRVTGAVLLEASTEAVRADIAREWIVTGVGIIAVMSVFCVLALGLGRWILRPLAVLSHSMGDLTALLPTSPTSDHRALHQGSRRCAGPSEIAALTDSFNTMALAVTDAVEAQRQFVAATAHSLRNPLSALSVRLDSLAALSPPTAIPTVHAAEVEVERLLGLLDNLLTLAKAETGFGPADLATDENPSCDAADVAAGRIDAWCDAYHQTGRRLVARLSGPAIAAMPAATLAQILDVALSNSHLYAGADATTTVSVQSETDSILITVVDDGVGVEDTELGKLTTRFFRGSSARTGGSGLGLSIAAALAHRHGGELTVEPVRPHGLCAVMRLRGGGAR